MIDRFRMPAEWTPHDAVWTAWPYDGAQWGPALVRAQRALMAMVSAIVDGGRGERVHVIVRNEDDEVIAGKQIGAAVSGVSFHHAPYGDVWLRDTGPIFVARAGEVAAARFQFDGWGGKYLMDGDPEVSARVMTWAGIRGSAFDFVLEGGAVDVDGAGTVMTTKQCLLGGKRNPGLDAAALEARLRWALGAEHVIWLDQGLINDHTDGHIDTLARFVAPGVVACMEPVVGDPNGDALDAIIRELHQARNARGERLEVVTVRSPGAVVDAGGNLMPASYMNFYIANSVVVVPTYGVENDTSALTMIQLMFRGRKVIGVPAQDLVTGGGAFHCCTQQQPRARGDSGVSALPMAPAG